MYVINSVITMTDDEKYKHVLFNWMTLRLMAHKYAYYVHGEAYLKDVTYDLEEKGWHRFGVELGLLNDDEHSPCIDFDWNHPMAQDAKVLSEWYIVGGEPPKSVLDILTKYGQV